MEQIKIMVSISVANGFEVNGYSVNKNFKNIMGIYIIYNKVNQKCYVGQSNNLYKRYNSHFAALRRGNHNNYYLQRSYNKYGESNFEMYVVKTVADRVALNALELDFIMMLNTRFNQYGYNLKLDTFNRENENLSKNTGHEYPEFRKPVVQLDLNGIFINRFDGIYIASINTKINYTNIGKCCNNKRNTAGKYIWVYEEFYNSCNFNVNQLLLKKNKIKDSKIQRQPRSRKNFTVIQQDKNGVVVREWDYPAQAKQVGFNPDKIYECCSGKIKSHLGFVWFYKT